MAWQDYIDEVQMLYVAYYQRPADPAGLRYWAQVIDNQGIQAAVNGFVNSPEAQSLYGGDITAVINAVYQAAFNRTPEPDGLTYWTNVYNNGWATLGSIVWEIVNGARNQDLITLQNKIESAMNFTNALDPDGDYLPPYQATYAGDADAAAGRVFLHDVTADPSTIKTVDAAKAFIQAHIADPGDPLYGTGQNITLTTGPDNILIPTPDTVDNIYGVAGNLETVVNTYNTFDVIQGNGKTILNLTLSPLLWSYSPAGPAKVTNVDKINLISGGSGTMYFDASNWSNIGSINLNAGADYLYAEFGQLQVGTDLYVGNLVAGALGAYYTDHVYVGIYSGRQAEISYADGTVNAYAQLGTNVGLSVSATADMTPINLKDINIAGALANNASIGIHNVQALAGGIKTGNISVKGFDSIYMHIVNAYNQPAVIPSDINIGNIALSVTNWGTIEANIWNGGYNNVGNIKVGDISIKEAYNSTGYFVIANTGVNYLFNDNVKVGNITAGNIDVYLDNYATLPVSILNTASASKGNATVGDITVGNVSATVKDYGIFDAYISNYAYAQTGNATVGSVKVGDVAVNIGQSAVASLTVSNYASASKGNAAVGDITVGNVSATLAKSGYFDASISNYAYAQTGNATVGSVKVGDVAVNIGQSAVASLTVSNSAYAWKGNAAAGDITVGNVSATLAKSGYFDAYISNYAYAHTGNATVGSVKVGDFAVNIGQSATASLIVYNSAYAWKGNAAAGDTTVGNVSATLAKSGYFDAYISNHAYAQTGNATVGSVKVGDFAVNIGQSAAAYLTVYNSAHAWKGNAAVGDITVGNVSATLAKSGYFDAYISNCARGDNTGDITVGSVKVGDVSFNVGLSATAYLTVYNSAYVAGIGDAKAGDISVGNISVTLNGTNAFASIYLYNHAYALLNDATAGNIKIGDITINANVSASCSFNLFATISASAPAPGHANAGSIYVGNITVSDVAASSNNLSVFAGPTGWFRPTIQGETVGEVWLGNVDYSGYKSNGATIDLSAYHGAPVIKGTANPWAVGDFIVDTPEANDIYLGKLPSNPIGDGAPDTVKFVYQSGVTNKVYNFETAGDTIQVHTTLGPGSTFGGGGPYGNLVAFLQAANSDISSGGTDIFYGYVIGQGAWIAVDFNNDSSLDYLIQVVGVSSGITPNFNLFAV